MNRRHFLKSSFPALAGSMVAPTALVSRASAATLDTSPIEAALADFRRLSRNSSYAIKVDQSDGAWSATHLPDDRLFVGSAVKTFILTRYLQDVEEGRLSEDDQLTIDDSVRSLSSPVFLNLTGSTPARSVLEAMITHSDNTATDAALRQVQPERVRSFLSEAGLGSAQIPTSTRHLFSYLAGAPFGVDEGWEGMRRIADGEMFGEPRSPMNELETMRCSAAEFVAYYERALAGTYFQAPETLTEFKRIQAMADAIPRAVPADVPAWGKGGSIEWEGFNCLCFPGQMLLGRTPATFCFTLNWSGSSGEIPQVTRRYVESVTGALAGVAAAFG
jgi:beta-lactamase class A